LQDPKEQDSEERREAVCSGQVQTFECVRPALRVFTKVTVTDLFPAGYQKGQNFESYDILSQINKKIIKSLLLAKDNDLTVVIKDSDVPFFEKNYPSPALGSPAYSDVPFVENNHFPPVPGGASEEILMPFNLTINNRSRFILFLDFASSSVQNLKNLITSVTQGQVKTFVCVGPTLKVFTMVTASNYDLKNTTHTRYEILSKMNEKIIKSSLEAEGNDVTVVIEDRDMPSAEDNSFSPVLGGSSQLVPDEPEANVSGGSSQLVPDEQEANVSGGSSGSHLMNWVWNLWYSALNRFVRLIYWQ
jgi:hypothetical protein